MKPIGQPNSATWHCVLDRQMRLLYLGIDEAEARKLAVEGTVLRSSGTRGNAMRLAAMAFGSKPRRRFGGGQEDQR